MALLSKKAQAAVAASPGGYLNPGKLSPGSSVRFALVSDEPLECYELWGVGPDNKARPFRFLEEPTPEDITAELGEYTRRLNYDGTAPNPVKFVLSIPVYNYEAQEIQVLSLSQKSLIRDLDAISQQEDYQDITACDFSLSKEGAGKDTKYKLMPLPRKKGGDQAIDQAWAEVQAQGFDLNRLVTGGNPFKAE